MPHPVTLTLAGAVVAERIRGALPGAVREAADGYTVLDPARMYEAMAFIRDDEVLDGKYLVQLCSVDQVTRIDVVYHIASLAQNHIFEVKVPADHERPSVALGLFRIRPRKPDPIKQSVYECGMVPVGDALVRYNVRYYLFALLFVVFDVEAIFLYPWAVAYRGLGVYAFVEALIFIAILLVGYVYAWRKRAMEWI